MGIVLNHDKVESVNILGLALTSKVILSKSPNIWIPIFFPSWGVATETYDPQSLKYLLSGPVQIKLLTRFLRTVVKISDQILFIAKALAY